MRKILCIGKDKPAGGTAENMGTVTKESAEAGNTPDSRKNSLDPVVYLENIEKEIGQPLSKKEREKYLEKFWENINFTNDFIFGKVMEDTEISGEFLKLLFPEFSTGIIKSLRLQKVSRLSYDTRGVRFDVFIEDYNNNVYDLEMQVILKHNLPKRSRLYQSVLDQELIEKGTDYDTLKDCYIIFISPNDMFGQNRKIYTFKNACMEDKDLLLNDGVTKIFLNASGVVGEVGKGLQNFLDYVATGKASNSYTRKIENHVNEAKITGKWKVEFMMMSIREMDLKAEAREEGKIVGAVITLHNLGFDNEKIRMELMKQYQISKEEVNKIILDNIH